MTWLIVSAVVYTVAVAPLGVLIGKSMKLADELDQRTVA